jgi:hypothetical protein
MPYNGQHAQVHPAIAVQGMPNTHVHAVIAHIIDLASTALLAEAMGPFDLELAGPPWFV